MKELSENYDALPDDEKKVIPVASHLGYFFHEERELFLLSQTEQIDLKTMTRCPPEDIGM